MRPHLPPPFTAGFLGKFYIFYAAIAHQQTMLIVVGVITVACGFYYYFKVIRAMYWEAPAEDVPVPVSGVLRLAMIAMMAGIIVLGIYPQPVINALQPAEPRLSACVPSGLVAR